MHPLLLRQPPLTVGALSDPAALGDSITPRDCDVVELRLDVLGAGEAVGAFARGCPLPLLLTARHPAEGGANAHSPESRAALLGSLLERAGAIDLELRSLEELAALWQQAGKQGVLRVASFHDFEGTPGRDALWKRIEAAAAAGADVAKLAFRINQASDLQTLLGLFERPAPIPLSVMGMGPLAPASRLLAAQLGSVLNYGYLGKEPTAPGQWPAALLKAVLRASR